MQNLAVHGFRVGGLAAAFAFLATRGPAADALRVIPPPPAAEAPGKPDHTIPEPTARDDARHLSEMNDADQNPLLAEWTTPFGLPPFDVIEDTHFLPAYEVAIAAKRTEIDRIANNPEAPTFANTIVALDRAGRLLDRIEGVFNNLHSADTNERRKAISRELAPRLAALNDDIRLNPRLFARVSEVWETRATPGFEAVQRRLLEETYKQFVRGGAALKDDQRERFRAINLELARLAVTFGDNLLEENNSYKLVIEDPADLAGLSDRVIQGAAQAARQAGLEGRWVFTLQWPSIWPFLEAADNRALRREILTAYAARGAQGGEQDNRATLTRIAALRSERARLLGFATHADFVLDDRMARTPARVLSFLDQLWKPALAMAAREAGDLQAAIDAGGGGFTLEAADWRYYTEKVRKARYDIDEQQLRPYFQLERVRDGVFYVAHRLYGITFTELEGVPVYHPEVRVFEVRDADGSHVGVFCTDFHPRPGKRGGAWSSAFRRQQVDDDGRDVRPIVVNVCNFSRPAGEAPALLSLDEVETLFHEFGHALHALFQRVPYRTLGRTSTDFVELPSQIMENWALEPEVLAVYARHYRTGEVIPADVVERIRAAERFNQGFAAVEYLAASYLDFEWHTWTEPREVEPMDFERAALQRIGLPAAILPRYRSPYFAHVFSGGYSAGYYSYMWSEVLDADAFEAFKERGLFDPTTALAFRREILERGGSADAMELYKAFRGREPAVAPLLARRGLEPASAPPSTTR